VHGHNEYAAKACPSFNAAKDWAEHVGGDVTVAPRPTLRIGDSGVSVRTLQRVLGGLTIDGDFGKRTDASVRQFQIEVGLVADGIVGAKTWEKLT
jgi:peptidoglycan hydrolase-like protein with peptidoglycan-binding domain